MADDLYFEDFTVGREFCTDGATVTESQILDFALAFDPQPFHLDLEAAKQSAFGWLDARAHRHRLPQPHGQLAQRDLVAAEGLEEREAGRAVERGPHELRPHRPAL